MTRMPRLLPSTAAALAAAALLVPSRAVAQGTGARAKLGRLLSFHPDTTLDDVPDPYYGGARGFEEVLDLVEASCDGLLRQLLKSRGVFGCVC